MHKNGSATLTAKEVEKRLPKFVLRVPSSGDCLICMSSMRKGERARRFPCSAGHLFHDECISQWLMLSSTCCPADREDVRDR